VALARAGMDIGITWHSDQAGAQDTAAQVRAADARTEMIHLDTSRSPRWRSCASIRTTDATVLATERCSGARARMAAQSPSARGLLYPLLYPTARCQ
jgi:hypothetical protein